MKAQLSLRVNGEGHEILVPVHKTLLEVLREDLGLTGTKHGCELGECGTCTVLVDGEPVLSCLALPLELEGREISTVEGMARGGELHPLQQAFAELGAAQCGYCTPGILLSAQSLLVENPAPTRDAIKDALAGNLCRCTGYTKILDAVELAALRLRADSRMGDANTAGHVSEGVWGKPKGSPNFVDRTERDGPRDAAGRVSEGVWGKPKGSPNFVDRTERDGPRDAAGHVSEGVWGKPKGSPNFK